MEIKKNIEDIRGLIDPIQIQNKLEQSNATNACREN